ncbi:MAG: FAD-dependent thymidylate synthase [Candidatus Saccharibacteria bacterium]|nr:FAD-dependent thymidylate synthase [Candidatus Saccharibacteria bacterium]
MQTADKKVQQGKFFVIEGTDASGKTTQFKLLADRLSKQGYDVVTFDFPQYDQESSFYVREYLSGKYGNAEQVGPYTASVFYALDRYAAKDAIAQAIQSGKIVLANRFTGSNMAHQGTKFAHPEERRGYFIWLDNLEYQMLGIPRPTFSAVLRVDADTSARLLKERAEQDPEHKTDIHEANTDHLRKSVDVYDDLCTLFPKDFNRIDCVRNNQLMTIEQIHELLWSLIEPALPKSEKDKGSITKGSDIHVPYTKKDKNGGSVMTKAGKDFLEGAVTNTEDNVYAFSDQMSPITIAAAMARLSRRGDDMRVTILDEFANAATKKDDALLRRVITAYGDDSVQQLVGQHVVVEGASNLLTKKLEWGRMASYLEQSTRYIYFDQKDENGKYRYVVPEHFDAKTKDTYVKINDEIFDTYSLMVRKLTDYVRAESKVPEKERDVAWQGATRAQACDAIRSVLPVSTKSTVGIFASGQALESLIMHLQSDELPEARETGQKLLNEGRKVLSTFLERADKPERGGATIAYRANTYSNVKKLAEDMLPATHTNKAETVDLVDFWPKNELDLVPDMLYEHSNLSLREIKTAVDSWTYEEKEKVFLNYMGERLNRRHKPGRAVEKAHYAWDLICDYGIFRDLQRHRMVDDLTWQDLTPRYGYDVPELVEEAGLTEQFQHCFDLSLKLHSTLVSAGYEKEAQYATLLGHKMRWKIMYNARQAFHLHELRTTPHGHPGYRKLVREMHDKLTEKHPLLGAAMKFVNQDEDPELTRLAAERYTQFKLNSL